MIISASRRTDLPRWYGEWFSNRLRAGYALVRNPMNASQLRRVSLTAADVDCFVFWTKDPAPFMPMLVTLDLGGYSYYFQFTLNPYGSELEPFMREKRELCATFAALSKRVGRNRIVWRYDPVILNDFISIDYHRLEFARLCGLVASYTDTVTVSFVDMYTKLKTNLIRQITAGESAELAGCIGETARSHGLRAVACCETADLSQFGILRAACIDAERILEITGRAIKRRRDRSQRAGCACAESADIGVYDTCPAGCVYCYANRLDKNGAFIAAKRRYEAHDPEAELLFGTKPNPS